MNKFMKKVVTCVAATSIFLSTLSIGYASDPILIHERSWVENISSGVLHEQIQKFTSEGWWNINVLRVDLDDRYTEIGALFSEKGISNRDTLTNMIKEKKAVAGINGDFFEASTNPYPLGAVVSNGKIVSTPIEPNRQLPVFSIDDNNIPFISSWDWDVKLIPENGEPIQIASINKDDPLFYVVRMYDKDWNSMTIGNTRYEDLVEVIVVDNEVADIRIGMEPVEMPENGYILVGRDRAAQTLLNSLNVGDDVELQINTTPDYESIKAAIGGGTLLVKDGKIADFTLNIQGNHPRTALGITKDRKQLIMVTIDGRDTSFKGVSQETLAKIMIDLGAYEAINFDGGGSTTMAVSSPGEEAPRIVNKPSDGNERKIINGIGIYSNAPQRSLKYIEVHTDDTNIFVNTTREFYIKGYDMYHNPVEVDLESVVFNIEGLDGKFKGNTLTTLQPGKGRVRARYKGKTAELEINVLNEVKDIVFEFDKLHINEDSQKSLGHIYGKNNEGYEAKIEPSDIEWVITGNIGKVEDGVFYSDNKSAFGAITGTIGNAVENILVSVGYTEGVLEDFEDLSSITFTSYPASVEGSIQRDNKSKEGNYSLRLEYDFTKDDVTRAAYVLLGENGIKIKDRPNKIGLWVYGNKTNHWLRGNLVDSNGNVFKLDFANMIDWKGWKWITADIPTNVTYPVTLERIYVVETNPLDKDKGYILMDGLKALYSTPYENIILPAETSVTDELNRPSELQENGYRFVVTNGIDDLNNLLKYHITNKIKDTINHVDLGINMNGINSKFSGEITKPTIEATTGFSTLSHKNSLFIQLDDTNNGIRQTNYQQWMWLKDKLEKATENNIFVLLPKPIFGKEGFTDILEAELLHEVLEEYKKQGKNIWVIHGGNETNVTLKSGIRYIQFDNRKIANDVDIFNLEYITFTVNDDEVTYEILPLFTKKSD